jgi:hypothetical protein
MVDGFGAFGKLLFLIPNTLYETGSTSAKPTQYGVEALGRKLSGKSQLLSAAAKPLANHALLLRVIVVVRVLLLLIGLGLGGGQRRAFRHYQHQS